MSDTTALRVGDKGRVVLPAALRERHGWTVGTALIAVEQDDGVLLLTRDELLARVRARLSGQNAVTELLDERREAARQEDGPRE